MAESRDVWDDILRRWVPRSIQHRQHRALMLRVGDYLRPRPVSGPEWDLPSAAELNIGDMIEDVFEDVAKANGVVPRRHVGVWAARFLRRWRNRINPAVV